MIQLSPPRPSVQSRPSHPPSQPLTLDVTGMKCAGCVAAVERLLKQVPGVQESCVNLVTAIAVVHYDAAQITDPQCLADHLSQRGFPSHIRQSRGQTVPPGTGSVADAPEGVINPELGLALLLLMLSGLGHLAHLGGPMIPFVHHPIFHWALATIAILIPGRDIFIDGWRGLRFGHANMNTLIALGTGSAYLTSCVAWVWPGLGWECFFDEPVMLLGVLLLGRTLEGKARRRAAAALHHLLALRPEVARLVGQDQDHNETGIEIAVDLVRPGEWVRVLPGEKIPVDGIVISGKTLVDEALLTGESIPVLKTKDDAVIAGTWNQSGDITIAATQVGTETTLARIIRLVETAQTQKAPIQRLADQVAGVFAYGVLALALLTLLFWASVGVDWFPQVMAATPDVSPLLMALKLSVSVLVVACPCALGLATPTAILVGTSLGAEQGILIKGGDVLETLQRLTTIAFDKTGTLTEGKLQLTDCHSLAPITAEDLLTLVASVEQGTRHPLAEALVAAAQVQGLALLPVDNIQTEAGRGVQGWINCDRLLVGNQGWLADHGVSLGTDALTVLEMWLSDGKTVIFVARNQQLIGLLALQDRLRPDAVQTIAALKTQGITPLLLTGDHPRIAQAIAKEVGIDIDQVYAQMTPQDKVDHLKTLQTEAAIVGMVGDGINDAPALAQADVGISLSGATDVAMETADVVLMGYRLGDLLNALTLSRCTVRKIYQNLFWALGYNCVAIPLAAGVFLPQFSLSLTPAIAAAMMAGSSIMVVLNALSLRQIFPRHLTP
ncbi:MAG: cation-translocating P-type ATPase [Synechocystis sp.]|nr:cation-translocating P-type ATPase [Synechocystis sp.]